MEGIQLYSYILNYALSVLSVFVYPVFTLGKSCLLAACIETDACLSFFFVCLDLTL